MYSGLILQPGVVIRGGRPVIQIWGRLDSGEPFLVEDDRFRPYFFVRERDADMVDGGVHGVTPELKRCELRNLAGDERPITGLPSEARIRNVRWAPDVDDVRRQFAERRYSLSQGGQQEGRTWAYALSDLSRTNVSALVRDEVIEDTQDIDRSTLRVSRAFFVLDTGPFGMSRHSCENP